MKSVFKENGWYNLLRFHADLCTYFSYRRVEVHGRKNIPAGAKVILTPNHCNALMDAMTLLRTKKGPLAFGARADIFKKKAAAEALFFLRILPLVRVRDGLRQVVQNYEAMDMIAETVEHAVPFCIFCEGTHRTKHSLLPIKKGCIRAALHARDRQPDDTRDIYLQPVGLEYGDHFRFRNTSLIEFGTPINVSAFLREHPDLPQAEMYRQIEDLMHERIAERITFIPDDEQYEGTWALTRIMTAGPRKGTLLERRDRNQAAIARIQAEPALQALRTKAIAFDLMRLHERISFHSFGFRHPVLRTVAKSLLWLVWLPFALVESLLALPLWLGAEILCHKIKDKAFCNSTRYLCKLFGTPILMVLYALIGFLTLPWYVAAGVLLALIPAYSCFYDFWEYSRILLSDLRLLFLPQISSAFRAIKDATR
ncbi:MAG: 1-acyl-sn-glycerol-3-phosphate acyltransferase [Bacteroidales bacterium]|nr:1-acyl-sn-glycerol-3-phosphate acyltransferase [Bacteroidales bacterium]